MEKSKILIVDEYEINRAILSELFCREFDILEADSSSEALQLIAQPDIRLIFLDAQMANMGAQVFLNKIKEMGILKKTPVLLLVNSSMDEKVQNLLEDVWDVIYKPFHPGIIRRRVSRILESVQLENDTGALVQSQLSHMIQWMKNRELSDYMIIDVLSTVLEFRMHDSGGHVQRIRLLTCLLLQEIQKRCKRYQLTDEIIQEIGLAAMMHDVGKIIVPDNILDKPGPLNVQEYEQAKQHTTYGTRLLKSIGYFDDLPGCNYYYDVCRWHHERWDGSGYPDGLPGDQIPIWAQVVGLADCYDTLVNRRVYKPAYGHQQAVQMILNGESGSFNPMLLEIFRDIEQQFYQMVLEKGLLPETENNSKNTSDSGYTGPYRQNPIVYEITANERINRLLHQEQLKYQKLADLSREITFIWDKESNLLRFSSEFSRVFGIDSNFTEACSLLDQPNSLIPDKDRQQLKNRLSNLPPRTDHIQIQLQLVHTDGKPKWYEVYIRFFWDETGYSQTFCTSFIGKLTCIDERKQQTLQWKQEATYDYLTGLYRRSSLEMALQQLTANPEKFAVLYMDVDHFKQINDQRGHLFGDKFLKSFANALRSNLRSTDLIARVGGDEFVAVLKSLPDASIALKKAQQLSAAFRQIPDIDGKTNVFSGSIGIAMYPEDGQTPEQLLMRADQALYWCKNDPLIDYARYSSAMDHT